MKSGNPDDPDAESLHRDVDGSTVPGCTDYPLRRFSGTPEIKMQISVGPSSPPRNEGGKLFSPRYTKMITLFYKQRQLISKKAK